MVHRNWTMPKSLSPGGCYGIGEDWLRGVTREHKGGGRTLAALKPVRAARNHKPPDRAGHRSWPAR
jgi:hypothetical protein